MNQYVMINVGKHIFKGMLKRWEDELLLFMDCCEVDVLLEDLFFRRLDEERVIRSVVEGFV